VLLLAAAATYALSAVDARRAADGLPPYLTTRIMMYGVSGLMVLTIAIVMITSIRARGGA
jgi:drug/metabolite transporter (DMT)-like permease